MFGHFSTLWNKGLNCFNFESLTNSLRISHHHSLIVTALKDQFLKGNVKIKFDRDYKLFDIEALKWWLITLLNISKSDDYSRRAPRKKKYQDKKESVKKKLYLDQKWLEKKKHCRKRRIQENWNNYKTKKDFFNISPLKNKERMGVVIWILVGDLFNYKNF